MIVGVKNGTTNTTQYTHRSFNTPTKPIKLGQLDCNVAAGDCPLVCPQLGYQWRGELGAHGFLNRQLLLLKPHTIVVGRPQNPTALISWAQSSFCVHPQTRKYLPCCSWQRRGSPGTHYIEKNARNYNCEQDAHYSHSEVRTKSDLEVPPRAQQTF